MKVLAQLAIAYRVNDGGTTHAPMIVAEMGGRERRLILDTGSEVHLLTENLADELGLAKEPGDEGTDHSGATMASWAVGVFSPSRRAGGGRTFQSPSGYLAGFRF